jgi:bifunctional DNase/RNase
MLVPAVISSFALDPATGEPIIILKSTMSEQSISISIGPVEAAAIAVKAMDVDIGQPLTIDLVQALIAQLGARLVSAVICDFRDKTFIARLEIAAGVSVHIVECRPCDAIALAMRCGVPVFIDEVVFGKISPEDGRTDVEKLRDNIAGIDTLDFGMYFLKS